MIEPGTRVEMTKGYKGVKGTVSQKTDSRFEFYIVGLDNGIHLVAGPSAFFIVDETEERSSQSLPTNREP